MATIDIPRVCEFCGITFYKQQPRAKRNKLLYCSRLCSNRRKSQKEIPIAIGSRFGMLTVLAFHGIRKKEPVKLWECRCDCGTTRIVTTQYLKNGKVKSCGCDREWHTTHNRTHTPEYKLWVGMLGRCRSRLSKAYRNYSGRGIQVCDRWLRFENFLADMGERPDPNLTLERIDNNGNYEPGNVRWATYTEQNRNNRNTRLITFRGITRCATDWAATKGMLIATFNYRLRSGWSIEQCITTPVKRR